MNLSTCAVTLCCYLDRSLAGCEKDCSPIFNERTKYIIVQNMHGIGT